MVRFLLNEDSRTIHAENPLAECNIPTARAEGEKGTRTVGFSGAAMAFYEDNFRVCEHCVGRILDDEDASPKASED